MRLARLNTLDEEAASHAFLRCCGSARWAAQMAAARPFAGADAMAASADAIWWALVEADWLEAFAAHPRIGLGAAGGSAWPDEEQAGVAGSAEQTRRRLKEANRDYEARFGYIFIVCATGKTGDELLALLERRLRHRPAEELRIAAEEQRKITQLRLRKLLQPERDICMITTHVLDISRGVPAVGVTVILELRQASAWAPIGRGTTDENGRVDTLTTHGRLTPGTYRLTFDIGSFHRQQGLSVSFFPEVKITFNVRDPDAHFHLPLLLSPFGYSTYRGTGSVRPAEIANPSDDV
jgi:5-hydroxyisourate hydrolase / 2-oxo-4-hydroxy-4-carboxy-5-ureidoimidazoline decarboxylase